MKLPQYRYEGPRSLGHKEARLGPPKVKKNFNLSEQSNKKKP